MSCGVSEPMGRTGREQIQENLAIQRRNLERGPAETIQSSRYGAPRDVAGGTPVTSADKFARNAGSPKDIRMPDLGVDAQRSRNSGEGATISNCGILAKSRNFKILAFCRAVANSVQAKHTFFGPLFETSGPRPFLKSATRCAFPPKVDSFLLKERGWEQGRIHISRTLTAIWTEGVGEKNKSPATGRNANPQIGNTIPEQKEEGNSSAYTEMAYGAAVYVPRNLATDMYTSDNRSPADQQKKELDVVAQNDEKRNRLSLTPDKQVGPNMVTSIKRRGAPPQLCSGGDDVGAPATEVNTLNFNRPEAGFPAEGLEFFRLAFGAGRTSLTRGLYSFVDVPSLAKLLTLFAPWRVESGTPYYLQKRGGEQVFYSVQKRGVVYGRRWSLLLKNLWNHAVSSWPHSPHREPTKKKTGKGK